MLKKRLLETSLLGLSLVVHATFLFWAGASGDYCFGRPVAATDAVMVELARTFTESALPETKKVVPTPSTHTVPGADEVISHAVGAKTAGESMSPVLDASTRPPLKAEAAPVNEHPQSNADAEMGPPPPKAYPPQIHPPLRSANEFLKEKSEKLRYRISMLGIPVGAAQLEAKNLDGEVRISLKVSSNPAVSSIYPVDDFIETRHIGGNFIITKIRQQEGSFKSNRGFTIFLRDKSVFWIDLLRNRSDRESLPTADVLDIFSGLYYLRNRPLQVGRSETLHVYDSDTYAELPVEVLRREKVLLAGRDSVNALVLRPVFRTDGIFRRTGDMLIWLTDDENKVPLKVETRIPIGVVTAELIGAESSSSTRN